MDEIYRMNFNFQLRMEKFQSHFGKQRQDLKNLAFVNLLDIN